MLPIPVPVRRAAIVAATTVVLGLAPGAVVGAVAVEPGDPIGFVLPSGQGVEISTDPPTITGHTGAQGSPAGQVDDFGLDLLLIRCKYSVRSDGTISCGFVRDAAPVPPGVPDPGPTAGPPSTPGPSGQTPALSAGPLVPGSGVNSGAGASAGPGGPEGAGDSGGGPVPQADGTVDGDIPVPVSGGGPGSDAEADYPVAAPLSDEEVLDLGVTGFALLTMIGSAGLAAASARTWRKRYPAQSEESEGSVLVAEDGMYDFDAELAGPGDRSRWWRLVTGWVVLDRLSRMMPNQMSLRTPLVARIAADGTYLRAILGVAWLLVPLASAAVGLHAASSTGGLPLPPPVLLVAVLICLSVLDATAGLLGVLGFAVGVLIWGPGDLGWAPGLRSFLGLAALWFAIPLIASASRPLRRTRERGALHTWDRISDGVIAALISGWAVQGAVGGMSGLSGRQSPIDPYADQLALIAMAAVAVRVGLEEISTRLFPERLKVVDTGILPEASLLRSLLSAFVRTAVFVFVSHPFIGSCWQLWVGAAIFAAPQVLGLFAERFANSERLFQLLPRGVAMVLFMIVVGLLAADWAGSVLDGPEVVRNGFVLLALPGLVVSVLAMFGRDGPIPARSWRNELFGAVVVAVSVGLVLAT